MRTCSRCGQPASFWDVDLTSGLCGNCRDAERAQRLEEEQAAADEQAQAAAIRQRDAIEARFGRCRDCGGYFHAIKLIDATSGRGLDGLGVQHVDLSYAAADATPSLLLGKIPRLGSVRGLICDNCGRIAL